MLSLQLSNVIDKAQSSNLGALSFFLDKWTLKSDDIVAQIYGRYAWLKQHSPSLINEFIADINHLNNVSRATGDTDYNITQYLFDAIDILALPPDSGTADIVKAEIEAENKLIQTYSNARLMVSLILLLIVIGIIVVIVKVNE